MLEGIDYGMVVLVWLAQAITTSVLCLIEATFAVNPAVCRQMLHPEVVKTCW
jgi:hypothetical protein